MSEMSPKELDKLFQQGSEEHNFEYNAEAWGQMENLLEKDDRRRRLIWWFIGGTLSFLFIATVWFLGNNQFL